MIRAGGRPFPKQPRSYELNTDAFCLVPDQREGALWRDLDCQLLAHFSNDCILRSLARFNLSARKLPTATTIGIPAAGQVETIVFDHCGDYLEHDDLPSHQSVQLVLPMVA